MRHRMSWRLAGIVGTVCLLTSMAAAQAPSFVGIWRCQTTMTGAGGYAVAIFIEDVFQPDGNFSSLTNSKYASGPAAGGVIGAVQASGTYTVDAAQGIIAFHNTSSSSTQPTNVPDAEYDRFQFISPTMFTLQAMSGGPMLTFNKVQ